MAPADELQDEALVLYDDGSLNAKVGRAGAVEVLLRYARPDVAAGVAVFGVGISALPLLARFQGAQSSHRGTSGSKAFAYAAFSDEVGNPSCPPGLLTKDELHARLGALDPAAVAAELQMDHREVLQHASSPAAGLDTEVQSLQRWHAEAQAAVASLERRSALAYLGLGSDAEADAIQKSYKQRVLTAHPDKGGTEEDFQQLQDMVARLQSEDAEEVAGLMTAGRGENLFQTLAKKAKQQKEKAREEEEEAMPLSKEAKLQQSRLKLHDRTLELWQRAKEAQRQCSGASGQAQNHPSLALLRQFVDGFASEAECLARGAGASAAAERLLCRFVRQGLEVLTAAALVDCAEVVRLVALNFTAILLRQARGAGPCPGLEQRCQFLLEALADVPKDFDSFLGSLQNRLEDQSAAEWRGCDEARQPVPEAAAAAPSAGPPAPDATAGAAAAAAGTASGPKPEPPSRVDPFALAVASFAASCEEGAAESAAPEPKPPAPARVDPFAAAVAAFAAASGEAAGKAEEPSVEKAPEREALVPLAAPEAELQRLPARESKDSAAYHQTEEWGKVRAHCVRLRLCVNFNRDSADRRCTAPAGSCSFKHVCAVCGAEDKGGPGAQYQSHGAWNCHGLAAWLMVHR